MSWLKKLRNWFAGCKQAERQPSPPAIDADEERFSRSAVDSTGLPMDKIFTVRMSDELHVLGGRKVRTLNISLGAYIRILLEAALDSPLSSVINEEVERVIRKNPEMRQ